MSKLIPLSGVRDELNRREVKASDHRQPRNINRPYE
jgi:hypothetical protein